MSEKLKAIALETRHHALLTLLFASGAAVLFMLGAPAASLSYNTNAPYEIAQILSCHFVHWNMEHFFWSVATFIVLGALCEKRSRFAFLACVLLAAAVIPVALASMVPEIQTYGGLSGLDCALFVMAAVCLIREKHKAKEWGGVAMCCLLILAFFAKVTFEYATGTAFFVSDVSAFVPVPAAHVVGGAIGALVGASCKISS